MVIKHILTPFEKRCLTRNRRIVQRRREGLDAAELARRFRLTPTTIHWILRAHQRTTGENLCRLPRKPRQRPEREVPDLSPLRKGRLARNCRIVRLRRKGQDVGGLARRFEVAQQTIRTILKSHAQATGEYLGQLPRKPHHFCPNCDAPVFSRKTYYCSRACYLAPERRKRIAEAKQVIPLRLKGRTWP